MPPSFGAWCLLVLREEAFRSVPAQLPLGPGSKVHGVFSNRNLSSTSGGVGGTKAKAIGCMFGESLGQP